MATSAIHRMRLICAAMLSGLSVLPLCAGDQDKPLFHSDPKHTWNRAHQSLYVAVPWRVDDQERLEPIAGWGSRFLVPKASPKPALEALDALLTDKPEARIKDPLKRAVFQHDLWAVFADTTGTIDGLREEGDSGLPRKSERRELQRRLAQAMRLAALNPEQIKTLPDNLAEVVRTGKYPKEFDPKRRDQPFLPPDLLNKDGPWVVVGNPLRPDGLGAPAHLGVFKGRSLFTVLIRLPGGRQATEAFVAELKSGKLPKLPTGTQTALWRRMLLVDDRGRLQPTSLTESLQIRVFHWNEDTGLPFAFKLSRGGLFAGKGGGLQPIDLKNHNCQTCHARLDGGGVRSIVSLYAGHWKRPRLESSSLEEQANKSIAWVESSYSWGLLQGLWETGAPALAGDDLQAHWDSLAGGDAEKVYESVWALARSPNLRRKSGSWLE